MYGAIILAAGKGTRFKGKKQFELINGIEMWKIVYNKTSKIVNKENIVVVGVDIEGGTTRSESVKIGLNFLTEKSIDRIIILEAARPLVTINQIKTLLEEKSKSTTFALPLVNTVIGRNGTYYDRNDFYNLLTPQAFDYQMLLKAYNSNKYTDTTDETIIMFKEYGIQPHFILDGENLVKVTYEIDIEIIKKLIDKFKEQ